MRAGAVLWSLGGQRGRGWGAAGVLRLLVLAVCAVLVAGVLEVVAAPVVAPRAAAATAPAAGEFVPLTQTRIVDTRIHQGLSGPVVAGNVYSFQVTGQGGVLSDVGQVAAVVMTITAVNPGADMALEVWAEGTPAPPLTNLIANQGQTVANSIITKVGSTGKASVLASASSTDFLVDVEGYYTSASAATGAATFVPLTLGRVYDSRTGAGPLAQGETRTIPVLGHAGVPSSGVSAVVLNVISDHATAPTWFAVWPGGPRPDPSSVLNVNNGYTTAAMVQVGVAADGTVSVYNALGTSDVVVDVEGYYLPPTADAANYYTPITP
ncbi:MAG TPA: hypothetical protein VFP72_02960, partial [Kineosporiaceae bacterium]|nr:hypothetical protein [Kineosporiaceae bacterium]